jgi:hypothetical protein
MKKKILKKRKKKKRLNFGADSPSSENYNGTKMETISLELVQGCG